MPRLTNTKITKVFEGKSGEGQYGPWTIYNFYIDKPQWKDIKFGYLCGGKKPKPEANMELDILEYEIDKQGQYTNYKVSKFVPHEEEEPIPVPETHEDAPSQNSDKSISMYISYAKDLQVARAEKMTPKIIDTWTLKEMAQEVVSVGKWMYQETMKTTKQPDLGGMGGDNEYPPDEIPPPDDNEENPYE